MAAGSGSDRAVNSGTKPPVGIAITQSSSLLRRMWTVAEPLFQQAAREVAVPIAAAEATSTREPQRLERLAAGWTLPAPPSGPAVGEIGAETDEEKPVSFYWVGNTFCSALAKTAWRLGRLNECERWRRLFDPLSLRLGCPLPNCRVLLAVSSMPFWAPWAMNGVDGFCGTTGLPPLANIQSAG